MPTVQEIYQDAISHLPSEERLRLAALILNDLAARSRPEPLSVTKLIESLPVGRGFNTSAEADEDLRRERDSWEH